MGGGAYQQAGEEGRLLPAQHAHPLFPVRRTYMQTAAAHQQTHQHLLSDNSTDLSQCKVPQQGARVCAALLLPSVRKSQRPTNNKDTAGR